MAVVALFNFIIVTHGVDFIAFCNKAVIPHF